MCGSSLLGVALLRRLPLNQEADAEAELGVFDELRYDSDSSPDSDKEEEVEKEAEKEERKGVDSDAASERTGNIKGESLTKLREIELGLADAVVALAMDPSYRLFYCQFGLSCGVGLFIINNLGMTASLITLSIY